MKKFSVTLLIVAALVAGVGFLGRSGAQDSAPASAPVARVAVCDVQEIFTNYTRAKDLLAQLNDKRQALAAEDEQRGKALDALEVELGGLKPGSKEYEARLAEAERLRIDRTVSEQSGEAALRREHRRLTMEMYAEVSKMAEAVAKERGFNLVIYRDPDLVDTDETLELLSQIRSRKVLYSDPSLDITKDVLARLNEAYRGSKP
ncbi:MAG: OmpH family outer membrane protein [Phycisphaerae bacterium]|jgi:Skp family chaperone for outer membrane proteins